MTDNVYVIGACRTAIGSFLGTLKGVTAVELGAHVLKEAIKRAEILPDQIDQVILGNVLQAGQGQNPARQVTVNAGLPIEVPALTINKVCGSGLNTIALSAALIKAGEADCIAAGGMESMSGAPYLLPGLREGQRMGDGTTVDSMIHEGLWDAFNDYHMGVTAENVAEQYQITREEQDEFALKSQMKAKTASETGKFKEEIVPVSIPQRKGDDIVFQQDEHIRPNTSVEQLARLRPAFKAGGTVTAGNASGINDAACIMLVVSEKFVKENHLKPLARVACSASCGIDPKIMGLGPVPTIKKLLKKSELHVDDIDLFEINEAFASQSIGVLRDLEIPDHKVNVNGGAIALGHPIGASGARIAATLLYEMKRSGRRFGVASLCIGGGMGEAVLFERDSLCQ
ncbi:acetyl-CoA C-acetyltransferase [Ruminococcus sp. OA3]|uniref:acetyl-CoA C-acetyltransferase n=1 Tax=Ruminococcus sp. OA3 TaxID=2914164 RepID=UPI001F056A11|nr:acetyl-CoA C-acetyltransferase [Ruminococcus sp. OA3]MCH1982274.1 acetyl-CoA C-acetyltransferase [Ruminococcus sp. OA3]